MKPINATVLIGFVLGALVAGFLWNRIEIAMMHDVKLEQFLAAGPRFTAQDGQRLCERVAQLEQQSIGFKQSGLATTVCDYVEKR